jgi:hypothetical protein
MTSEIGLGLGQLIIPAAAGLLGVVVGGWTTSHNQKKERKHNHSRQQLECFYGPLLAMRLQIRSKSELRAKLHGIANAAWQERLDSVRDDPAAMQAVEKARGPKFDKVFDYSDEQFRDELIPLYRKMLEHFTQYMWLAEPSTLGHFAALVKFVELWNRFLATSLPHEMLEKIDHSEKELEPLYQDLAAQAERLRQELKK